MIVAVTVISGNVDETFMIGYNGVKDIEMKDEGVYIDYEDKTHVFFSNRFILLTIHPGKAYYERTSH